MAFLLVYNEAKVFCKSCHALFLDKDPKSRRWKDATDISVYLSAGIQSSGVAQTEKIRGYEGMALLNLWSPLCELPPWWSWGTPSWTCNKSWHCLYIPSPIWTSSSLFPLGQQRWPTKAEKYSSEGTGSMNPISNRFWMMLSPVSPPTRRLAMVKNNLLVWTKIMWLGLTPSCPIRVPRWGETTSIFFLLEEGWQLSRSALEYVSPYGLQFI